MKIKCGCKVNLYLRITGKREDGYHDLDTIFLPLDAPYDILRIKKQSQKSEKKNKKNLTKTCEKKSKAQRAHDRFKNIQITCDTKGIDPKNNTLTKAYDLYSKETGFAPKLSILLKKGIPHGAGLGGGSSNAAHLLQYLQKENKKPLSQKKLINLAACVGADVPFFLYNSACHALGIGEQLTPISLKYSKKQDKHLYLVLVSPHQSVSTKEAFEALDPSIFENKNNIIQYFKSKDMKKSLAPTMQKDYKHVSKNVLKKGKDISKQKNSLTKTDILDTYQISCYLKNLTFINDFEKGVFAQFPFIEKIKKELLNKGAFMALLSGTGSSVYGIFEKKEQARKAVNTLKKLFQVNDEKQKTKVKNDTLFLTHEGKNTKIRVYPPQKIL